MNETPAHDNAPAYASGEEMRSALFANMIVQQTNLAMMLLGKVPHPETGQHIRELDGAKMFIDQLEMLEVKTKGNLEKQEEALLKQSLMMLHLAYVEAVNAPAHQTTATANKPGATTPTEPATSATANPPSVPASEEESRKKFSKKY
ncbi:MAG: DUF1844 domain-containing protein [Verrucomicrobia bacterium]|nr:DUF1844 domain-containing protein [Verrucomicrobiota bacterium]